MSVHSSSNRFMSFLVWGSSPLTQVIGLSQSLSDILWALLHLCPLSSLELLFLGIRLVGQGSHPGELSTMSGDMYTNLHRTCLVRSSQ